MNATAASSSFTQPTRLTKPTGTTRTQTTMEESHTKNTPHTPLSVRKAPGDIYSMKMPLGGPQPVIKKTRTVRRTSTNKKQTLSTFQYAIELESKLKSSLAVAAGGIMTLTKNIIARHSKSKLMNDEQLSQYITRLAVISEELKSQLDTLGRFSKLSNQQDHNSFELSYRKVLAFWEEYQRVSVCVVQRARLWKQRGKVDSDEDGSSGGTSMSDSSTSSEGTMGDRRSNQ